MNHARWIAMTEMDYLERYLRGNHQRVWQELTELGVKIWEEQFAEQAKAIARETMTRVRRNVESLIPRLQGIGYRFSARPHIPPTGNENELINEYERKFGVFVPLSLRTFYEVIGAVDFRGDHADWTGIHDPLQIYGLEVTLEDAEGWQGQIERIYLCPCPLMKEGYSAVGPQYLVPGRVADSSVGFEGGDLPFTFVQYLRNFFRWGGFAGCVKSEEEFARYPDWVQPPTTHRDYLAADLVRF
jgi:hypothetical protein